MIARLWFLCRIYWREVRRAWHRNRWRRRGIEAVEFERQAMIDAQNGQLIYAPLRRYTPESEISAAYGEAKLIGPGDAP